MTGGRFGWGVGACAPFAPPPPPPSTRHCVIAEGGYKIFFSVYKKFDAILMIIV